MKIINKERLENGDCILGLSSRPTSKDAAAFYAWAGQCDILEHIILNEFTKPCDIGYQYFPGILVRKNAPDHVKTLLLLAWE